MLKIVGREADWTDTWTSLVMKTGGERGGALHQYDTEMTADSSRESNLMTGCETWVIVKSDRSPLLG